MSTETTYEPFWWKEITKDWVAKWQTTQPWATSLNIDLPIGTELIAELNLSGRIIDGIVRTANGQAVPTPLPISVMALDQAACDFLAEWYGPELLFRIHAVEGVIVRRIDPPPYQPTAEEIKAFQEFQARRKGRG
jgi:hypothetical protein